MLDVKSEEGISKALENLADVYGPIFQITLNGQRLNIIASAELLKQVTDERYFVKLPPPALDTGTGPRGLFLARNDDPDWLQAHRILSPAFGVLPVQDMLTGWSRGRSASISTNGCRYERYRNTALLEMGTNGRGT